MNTHSPTPGEWKRKRFVESRTHLSTKKRETGEYTDLVLDTLSTVRSQ